jgi:hypothetical protein
VLEAKSCLTAKLIFLNNIPSSPTPPTPPPTAPVNTIAPEITGGTYVGDVLTTTNGTWSGSPSSYAYQWKRGATNIGTNTNIYRLLNADANTNISCVVTATNASGSTPATSNIVTTSALFSPVNIEPPAIDSSIFWIVGDTLYFNYNQWDGNPVPTLTYQWLRDGANIVGATDNTYTTIAYDEGYGITVKCTATNSQGTAFVVSNEVFINVE